MLLLVLMLNCLVSPLTFVFVDSGDHECGQHRVVFRRGCEATAQHRHDHCDDQLYSTLASWEMAASEPESDELASQAAIYTDAYVPSSVCRLSLATLLTVCIRISTGALQSSPPGFAKDLITSGGSERIRSTSWTGGAFDSNRVTLPRILRREVIVVFRRASIGKVIEECRIHRRYDDREAIGRPLRGQAVGQW